MERGWNDLLSRSVDLGAGMVRLYGDAMRDLMTGKLSYSELSERALGVARDEGGAYTRALTRAYLDYWSRVLDVGQTVRDRMAGAGGCADGTTTRTTARGVTLSFTGKPGEEIARGFVVANNQAESIDVSFEAAAFTGDDGCSYGRLAIAIDPERFTLPAGQEQVVTCRLTLAADLAAARPYTSRLRVIGFPDMELLLVATVL